MTALPTIGALALLSIASAGSTPAERAIETARAAVEADAKSAEARVSLASALSRRARETAEPGWYDRSDEALAAALRLDPKSFAAQRLLVWNQLGRHEFAEAYDAAKALNERSKDDVMTYGLLVDACVELGRYEEAEEAAQWMLNLRPGAPAALTRVSYLRELFGDVPGAIDVMRSAFHSSRASEAEDRAWILTHLAHLELERGRVDAAEGYAEAAVATFEDYHYALKELACVRSAQGRHGDAVTLLRRRYEVAPHPENLFDLALAVEATGARDEARTMFETFEEEALAESRSLDNANLELCRYWLDVVGGDAATSRALALVERRARSRRDVLTLEWLAWARYRSGDVDGAASAIDEVLAVGTRNARARYRAGLIARAAGDDERAHRRFESAFRQSPDSREGRAALAALQGLDD